MAAERTTQVVATDILGGREKPNAAVDTARHAALKSRMDVQCLVELRLILQDKRLGAVLLVPIGPKRENLREPDDKKTRFSVIIEMFLCTPSSYQTDAKLSIGRARLFLRCGQESPASVGTTRSALIIDPGPSDCRLRGDSLRVTSSAATRDHRSFAGRTLPPATAQVA